MLLLDFADEMLLEILSHLTASDLHRVCTCSRRLSSLALPELYREIRLLKHYCGDWENVALDRLLLKLELHPERAGWIQTATLRWMNSDSLSRSKMFGLVRKLANIQALYLIERNALMAIPEYREVARAKEVEDFSVLLAQCAPPSLQRLEITDYQITIDEVFKLFRLTELRYLCISELNVRLSQHSP